MDVLSELLSAHGYHWLWFALATILLIIEAMIGGFFMLAASVAALVVGALTGLYPYVGFEIQLLFFAVIAPVLMWVTHSYLKDRTSKNDKLKDIVENQRYVGRKFSLVNPITDGNSSINIDGVVWHIQGGDTPAGCVVKIVKMDEGTLIVEPN
ncbi:NfeD family protein [Pseudomonadota bacterium]